MSQDRRSSGRLPRRHSLTPWLLAAVAAIAAPTVAAANPGNGNAGPPAAPQAQPPGHANGHANGNANGQGNAQANRQSNGNNGVRAHGNPPAPRSNGNNGVRAHGNPPAPRGNADANGNRGRGNRGSDGNRGGGDRGMSHKKTTICHSTNSDTNPYVEITVSDSALKAHRNHHDGADIIPAPAGGCPTGAAAPTDTPAETPVESLGDVVAGIVTEVVPVAEQGVAGVTEQKPGGDANARVLGAVEERGDAAAGTSPAAEDADDDDSLPFTGLELVVLLAAGIALLLAGLAGRRALANRV